MAPPSCYSSRCCGLMIGLFCVVFFVVYLGWCIYSVKVSPERPYFPFAILLYVYVSGAAVSLTFACLFPSDDNDMLEQDPEDRPPRDDIEMNVLNLEQQSPSRQVQADVPDVNSASDSIQGCSQTESAAQGTDQSESGDGVVLKPGQPVHSQTVHVEVYATDSAADSVRRSTGKRSEPDSADPVTDLAGDKEKVELNPEQVPEDVPDQHSQSQKVIAEVPATDSSADSVRRSTGKQSEPDSADPVTDLAGDKEKAELNPEQVPVVVPDAQIASEEQTRFRRAVSEQTVFRRATKTDSDASSRWNTQ